jgi:CubicO group peptidase (beta-lactamase class C family)
MTDLLKEILYKAIDEKVFPGCALAVICDDKRIIISAGRYTYNPTGRIVDEKSVFDVASLTKVIPTSSLALKLIELGRLSLSDKLIQYLPEYQGAFREKITVWHLLTQTLNFNVRLSDIKHQSSEKIIEAILHSSMIQYPGLVYSYANATSILLGLVIERVCEMDLESAGKEYVFGPLRMSSTSFYPQNFSADLVVPSEYDDWRGREICGEVHDESAWALRPKIVGSAGLFSTINDMCNFLEMILMDGQWRGKQVFSKEIVTLMRTRQIIANNRMVGLGWELNQRSFTDAYHGFDVFGKTGFTGCTFMFCPSKKSGFVFLNNHIYPKRRADRNEINKIRRRITAVVVGNQI